MAMLLRLIPDRFVLSLLATVLVASLLPVRGGAAVAAGWVSTAAIFCLFFLHGLRLPRADIVAAVRNWRLQAIVFAFVFALMPLAALALAPLGAAALPAGLVTGLLFLGILPSTVQSAISYAAIAGGNVAASIMAAALLNLAGVIVTPLLLTLVIGSAGEHALAGDAVIKIAAMLLLPFAIGQLLHQRLGSWAARQKPLLALMDRGAIVIAVYVALSGAVAGGLWQRVDLAALALVTALLALLLGIAFASAWMLGALIGLARPDRITLLFAGAHKSIASGAPLAAILFAGPQAGMVILPALIYHQLQLIVSAPLATRLARGRPED